MTEPTVAMVSEELNNALARRLAAKTEIDRLKTLLQTWTDAKDADVDTLRGLGLLEGER